MRKLFVIQLFFLFILFSSESKACCYNGGEITWECTSSGNYRFIMKIYRECYNSFGTSCNYSNHQLFHTNVPGLSSLYMYRITGYPIDISPVCNCDTNFPHIYCGNPNPMPNFAPNLGAIQEHIFTSDYSYPNGVPLTGVPPANGWVFYWSSCCRIFSTNINNGPSLTYRLRAIMYPYSNQNVSTCFDNSPTFAEIPQTVFCTGYPTTFNYLVSDNELDSLVYSWGQPLISTGAPITYYATGYSWNSPFPGPSHNSNNVAATIHPNTGNISFTSFTTGTFLILTKVTAFKCGVKVAEIWREFQLALTSCGTNNPPNLTAPFKDTAGQFTLFIDTVYAGQFVSFNIHGIDSGLLPNSSQQTISLEASGSQFGNVIDTTTPPSMSNFIGCNNPPCATLAPAPAPPTNPLTGQSNITTQFNWQTNCGHLTSNAICGLSSCVYNFVFSVKDDYCPVPGANISTVTIVVVPPPDFLPPSSVSVITDSLTGNNILNWNPIIDSLNLLRYYYIYSSTNCNGPFTILDSVFSITNSYTHTGANGNSYPTYYYIKTIWNCIGYKYSSPSDTVVPKFTDIGISKIISPIQNGVGDSVYVKIVNFGSDTISSCNVSYDFGGSLAITETWAGILLPCDSVDYTFTTLFNPPTANYILCANTLLPNDQNTSNDQICLNVYANINNIQNYKFKLFQNIPNPTNKSTTINYYLPKSGKAIFKVVNIVGEIIYSKEYKSIQGKNKIELDISNFDSGVYYYSLEFEVVLKVKKMIVLK